MLFFALGFGSGSPGNDIYTLPPHRHHIVGVCEQLRQQIVNSCQECNSHRVNRCRRTGLSPSHLVIPRKTSDRIVGVFSGNWGGDCTRCATPRGMKIRSLRKTRRCLAQTDKTAFCSTIFRTELSRKQAYKRCVPEVDGRCIGVML